MDTFTTVMTGDLGAFDFGWIYGVMRGICHAENNDCTIRWEMIGKGACVATMQVTTTFELYKKFADMVGKMYPEVFTFDWELN